MGRNTGKDKVAYSWISSDPAKAGLTLGVVVVVVVLIKQDDCTDSPRMGHLCNPKNNSKKLH